jgi:hypothetical protein
MVTMAALAAAQLTAAAPGQAAGLARQDAATQAGVREGVESGLEDKRAAAIALGTAAEPLLAAPAEQEAEPRKKRKSTGDKVLTGAAVVLGIGALAVGGLLVAIFVD